MTEGYQPKLFDFCAIGAATPVLISLAHHAWNIRAIEQIMAQIELV